MTRGTLRRHVRIECPPDKVWELVGDPARLPEWWPGITDAVVDGSSRVITMGSGLPMPEEIVTRDDLLRRFQYRITTGLFQEHLSTLDVLDLGDGSSLVVYGVDADPSAMALIIGGAAGNALEHLRTMLEGEHD
jgi:hypothetical protein